MSRPVQKDYVALMRGAGLRVTGPRRIILELVAEAGGHPDAYEIHRRAQERDRRISLATVYRTMKVLEDIGAIQRHVFEGGPARFENAQRRHHDHLIDIETGAVIEFTSNRIEALQEEIAARLGYEIVHHRLELYGRKIR
ncbi:MAG TPA: Fur family transcriptional regulator [Paracoccaceae bacterium]|nr:Fur family transcriptional regulator [Paracoccaceae bacterium]